MDCFAFSFFLPPRIPSLPGFLGLGDSGRGRDGVEIFGWGGRTAVAVAVFDSKSKSESVSVSVSVSAVISFWPFPFPFSFVDDAGGGCFFTPWSELSDSVDNSNSGFGAGCRDASFSGFFFFPMIPRPSPRDAFGGGLGAAGGDSGLESSLFFFVFSWEMLGFSCSSSMCFSPGGVSWRYGVILTQGMNNGKEEQVPQIHRPLFLHHHQSPLQLLLLGVSSADCLFQVPLLLQCCVYRGSPTIWLALG